MAVDRVGEGWSLFLQALRPAAGPITVRFTGFGQDAVLYAHGRSTPSSDAALHIADDGETAVYVGPPENIVADRTTLIAGADVPVWLRERLLADLNRVSERMAARMGRAPPAPTLIVTSRAGGCGQSFKGGALGGDIVEIRLRGMVLREDDEALEEQLTGLATHETVHFWIGQMWPSARNSEEPWLHEGATEYLASRIWQNPASLAAEAQQRLTNCLFRSNTRPLDGSEGAVVGQVSYDCGFMIMLAAEAASVRTGR